MLTSHARNTPSLRVRAPESTAGMLRAHFARHNFRVVLLSIGTLVVAAGMWVILYIVCTWIFIIGSAIFEVPLTRVPRGFAIVFAVAALCAMVYAWIDRRLTPNERASDKAPFSDVVSELVLAIPRITLSIGGTLAAWQRLTDQDYEQAATLLHHIAEDKRLPMSSVRLDIPDPVAAMRILFGLQITQVIDLHRDGQEFWLKLNALRPRSLGLGRESYADA